MSKLIKDLMTRELKSRYGELEAALWVDLTGTDGVTTNQLRRELRANNMRAEIVKNSLFRRACADAPLKPLADVLDGPAMLLTGGDSLIDIAKLLDEWKPKLPSLKLRGAVMEGEYYDEQRVAGLAQMPTKADLHARIAGILCAPGANLAAAMLAGGGAIAACLKTLIEKLEKDEPADAAPAADAAAPADAPSSGNAPAVADAPAVGDAAPASDAAGGAPAADA